MRTRRLAVVVLCVSLLVLPANAEGKELHYSDPVDHYSLTFPAGWKEAPQALVDLSNQLAKQKGIQNVNFVQAFQPAAASGFDFPYLLIQRHASTGGTLRVEELFEHVRGENMSRELARTKEKLGGLIKQAKMEEPSLDLKLHRILWPVEMDAPLVGKIKGLCVMCVGKRNMVQLNFYAKEADWEAFAPECLTVADALKFDPGFEYEEKHWPFPFRAPAFEGGGAFVGGIAGVIIGALIGGFFVLGRWLRKKKSRTTIA